MIGLTFFCVVSGRAREPEAPADVAVSLESAVMTTPGSIDRAKQMANHMFAAIGIKLSWHETPGRDPAVLIKVLLVSAYDGDDGSGALGETAPFARDHEITIHYDRVQNSAGLSRELEPLILGHVLVHEITHVLQCVNRHSDSGIMKARWSAEDFCDMRWKPLEFTPEDVMLIRLGLRALRSRADLTRKLIVR